MESCNIFMIEQEGKRVDTHFFFFFKNTNSRKRFHKAYFPTYLDKCHFVVNICHPQWGASGNILGAPKEK